MRRFALAAICTIAVVGYVLATLWRALTDWRQPEPEDHPFRNLKYRARGPT